VMSPSTYTVAFEVEMAMAHVPVLAAELLELLDPRSDSRVIDCTFGAGGHAAAVGARLGPEGVLVACDRDPVARDFFESLRPSLRCPARFYSGDFADTLTQLARRERRFTHVYMDLGVSSMQVDTQERGFSYSYDAPLDMRMDPDLALNAADILNGWDEARMARIFREYGEERYARRIAREVVRRRERSPYTRTLQLVETVPATPRAGSSRP
jgi:16S rRNA (cytosine1402-N4)-methyltransferase